MIGRVIKGKVGAGWGDVRVSGSPRLVSFEYDVRRMFPGIRFSYSSDETSNVVDQFVPCS